MKCVYCNAGFILSENSQSLSEKTLMELADFLPEWQGSKEWAKGVSAICIAGGGESLLNKYTGKFIDRCIDNGVEVGIVTNGVLIDKYLESLSRCTWVGVSVDAASGKTFKALKGVDLFDKVIDNISLLVDYSNKKETKLSTKLQGYGVSYKYLLHPLNVYDVGEAVKIAKDIGCRNFHLRPVGVPWDKLNTLSIEFSMDMISALDGQIERARNLEDDNFGVFGITHKFGDKLEKQNCFKKCYAIFMTGVVCPSKQGGDTFDFGLCCDRRGDPRLRLGENLGSVEGIAELWGTDRHWYIFDKIKLSDCCRCTYNPHNIIYENVIENDNMTYKFI
jgi:pyruvate-formate lyase-activating enzyme